MVDKIRSAEQWGKDHGASAADVRDRKSCGPNCTQAIWFEEKCPRADYMLHSLRVSLTPDEYSSIKPAIHLAITEMLAELIRDKALSCGIPGVELWAKDWLDGYTGGVSAQAAEKLARAVDPQSAVTVDAAWAARSANVVLFEELSVGKVMMMAANDTEALKQVTIMRKHIPKWEWSV